MRTQNQLEFSVSKENNSIYMTRSFNADVETVWEAWTNPELLDLWWAPKPYRTETKYMDFREGGYWLYAMISPDNEYHWCKNEYISISPLKEFAGRDAFCSEDGEINTELPRALWHNTFIAIGDTTTVHIHTQYQSFEEIETIIKMGFKEGFASALENLDNYIEAQFKLRQQNKTSHKARVCSYLNFDGKTEEAFLFYKQAFGTEFIGKGIQRFGEIPESSEHPPVADSIKNMVLHVELPITGGHVLMGTDAPKEMGFSLQSGNNMHICIEPETREEADRLFKALSGGGTVTMPMADMFFGAYFGEFSDKYGINWMINHQTVQR